MKTSTVENFNALLAAWSGGECGALERLLPLVYDQLRRIAEQHLRKERYRDHTLQPADLVHETYLRLGSSCDVRWRGRDHFLAIASTTMRRLLVERARSRGAAKRNSGQPQLPLFEADRISVESPPEITALGDCLSSLATIDPVQALIVELRFFGGLSVQETAAAVGCSRTTVIRQWRMARAWLHRELSGPAAG